MFSILNLFQFFIYNICCTFVTEYKLKNNNLFEVKIIWTYLKLNQILIWVQRFLMQRFCRKKYGEQLFSKGNQRIIYQNLREIDEYDRMK